MKRALQKKNQFNTLIVALVCCILGLSNAYSQVTSTGSIHGAFTVNGSRSQLENVTPNSLVGIVNGVFSVSNSQQVLFSQGNLQYIGSAATPYWKFADHQWDYLGTTTGQNSDDQNVDRDLFGWGTSGYNHGAVCYQPWSTSTFSGDYYAYGENDYNLYDETGQADWGYNAIANGNNVENIGWRTLTKDEWNYLFDGRNTTSNIFFAKAVVNDVNGVILLPDDWNVIYYSLSSTNSKTANYSSNILNASQWNHLEQHGAVFLPAAYFRRGTVVEYEDSFGYYWSAFCSISNGVSCMSFSDTKLSVNYSKNRFFGYSVRLVHLVENYTVTLNTNGGTINSGDVTSYTLGVGATLPTDVSRDGHTFEGWYDNPGLTGTAVTSISATAMGDLEFWAKWSVNSYAITAAANPADGGTVTGAGTYDYDNTCTLTATASAGYRFENWTEGGEVVSNDAVYTFTVSGDRNLSANFQYNVTEGYVHGFFSVGNGQQVLFSQGNLQYIGSASTPYWKFADHQWDYLGATPSQQSNNQPVDRDLFGWGTSGYNHGAVCYQPWHTSSNNNDYFVYGNINYNLNDQTGQADWGYNAILNGGNHENAGWRTLTHEEWDYLFNTRSTTSNIRYAKAQVNNVKGVILLPDDWSADYYTLNNTNTVGVSFDSNNISASDWATLEQQGAVFLPAAGARNGTSVNNAGSVGFYSSASFGGSGSDLAYDLVFQEGGINASDRSGRHYGPSVRLVFPAEYYSFVAATPNPTEGGTVSGAGVYLAGVECTLTATASAGYTFAYWTEDGAVVSYDAEYTITVTGDRDLVANFTQKGPIGNLNGQFTVGENAVVAFSPGNLQYIGSASTPYWKFADHQWDYLGTTTGQNSASQTVDRDLFGWGTSGYNHGAESYQPWSISSNNDHYKAYGNISYNLNDQTGKADWGYNAILNGGNQENIGWRTLTHDEWEYLLHTRSTTSNIHYAMAQVNNVNGLILLPDDWSADYFTLNNTDTVGVSFDSNTITASQWTTLERHGAVFLPAAGVRNGTTVNNLGSVGFYSSASSDGSDLAYDLVISDGNLNASDLSGRHYGLSVRLVLPVENYSINAIPSPAEGGSVSGVGTYLVGTGCTLTATTSAGYTFESWTENGAVVSTDAEYTFIVTGDRNLVAQFRPSSLQGIVNGVFSVNNGQQVFFSQGNLQYIGSASTPYWKFADHQWDYIGATTGQQSNNQNVNRDLFGWGTSGYNHGAVCYQPWSTSENSSNYSVYGYISYNLNDQTGKADWGYNAILNGGNHENSGWRTLTHDEWEYLFNTRSTTSNLRYAKAQVNGVNGVILLPDDWSADYYMLSNANTSDAGFGSNIISASDWATLEERGAVFLSAAGSRKATTVNSPGSIGFYWSASFCGGSNAYDLVIKDQTLSASDNSGRYYGLSVRLVFPAEHYSFVAATPSPTEGGSVSGAGNYHLGAECTLMATASANYTFVNWTENGVVVSTDAEYTFTVTGDRTLVANFTPIIYSQEVSLAKGWNWWAPTVQCTLEELETALETNGLTIMSKDATATYSDGQWSGTLTELRLGQMYRIETSGTCTFTLNGSRPASVTLTLDSGLNWFGCIGTETLTLANAFANFTPTEGDKVISQDEGFAIYNGTTWEGTLTTLQPGHGYVYVSQGSTTQTAIFGTPSK